MPRSGKVTLVSLETRLHADRFEEIFRLSCDAGRVVHKEMQKAVIARTGALARALEEGIPDGGAALRDADDDNDMRID